MKRNLLILLCACSLLISCQQQEQFATIDFGTAEFEEPFRGPLASQPSWLVATLDWPILRILKSDTVVLSKTIEIGFNEDAVRSNASARIFIVDENGNTSKKYQISCNNTPMGKDGYDLKATSEPQQLELVVKVDPSIGDTTVRGYISIVGNEIDEVNSIPLTEEGAQNVAQWSFTHEIGWPLMIWKIWMFLLILLIILIVYLLKYLVIGIASLGNSSAIAGAATSVSTKDSITKPTQKYTNNRKNKKNGTSNEYINEALLLESKLFDLSYSIASKNEILEKLRLHLESTKESDPDLNEKCYQALRPNTQKALDKFNEFYGTAPKNSTGGHWTGDRANSTYILSKQNTYYNECKQCGMQECTYNNSFEPDFTKATHPNSVVEVSDLYEKYTSNELSKRGGGKTSFQEVAQNRMAQNLDSELRSWWRQNHKNELYDQYKAFYEWRDAHNLVPHEDANCKTMRLVNRSVHKAFTHAGGISHAIAIKDYFG